MGVPKSWGYPGRSLDGWFRKIPLKWMITGGTSISGNLHIYILWIYHTYVYMYVYIFTEWESRPNPNYLPVTWTCWLCFSLWFFRGLPINAMLSHVYGSTEGLPIDYPPSSIATENPPFLLLILDVPMKTSISGGHCYPLVNVYIAMENPHF